MNKYREVLHIEDDMDHVDLVKTAAAMAHLPIRINRVVDGVEALQYLKNEGEFSNAVRPDLIILDLNAPRMDGLEALKAIREVPGADTIELVILSNRELSPNVVKKNFISYDNLYKKPVGINGYVLVMKAIENFFEQHQPASVPK